MKTYATIDHALKIPKLSRAAVAMLANPQLNSVTEARTKIIIVRTARAIPKGAKRATPTKEFLKNAGWLVLSMVAYGVVIYSFTRALGDI